MATAKYNEEDFQRVSEYTENIKTNINSAITDVDNMISGLDVRLAEYYATKISNIQNAAETADISYNGVQQYGQDFESTVSDYKAAKSQAEGISDVETQEIGDLDVKPPSPQDLSIGDVYKIDSSTFDSLPDDVKDKVKQKLKDLGFTDDEIEKILSGEKTVSKMTVDALSDELADCAKDNPELKAKLENLLGYDMYNEDGTVNKDLLALAMIMGGKGLGMDINLNPGTPFSKLLDSDSDALIEAIAADPELRKMIIEKYGIDPFNEDGTIDREKLAIIKMMDGIENDPTNTLEVVVGEKLTLDQLTDELTALGSANPEFRQKLTDLLGYDIFNEDGTIDPDKLKEAIAAGGDGIGMKIDLFKTSEFRGMIDGLSDELSKAAASNPDIRQQILDKYGIDIFKEDGSIDREKLALIKMMDGIKGDDDYNLEKMLGLGAYKPTGTGSGAGTGARIGTGSGTGSGTGTGSTTERRMSTEEVQTGTSLGGDALGLGGSSLGTGSGVGTLGADVAGTDGLDGANASLLDVLGRGASRLASKVSPYDASAAGQGQNINTNGANAGLIAAAGLAAGGAAAGGGILAGKKLAYTRFTPEDWEALGEDYQSLVEKVMKSACLTEDEIETFKNSKFKIRTSELKEHVKKIEKAIVASPDVETELTKLYGFSMLDENGRIIDYLLFITMIIDGKNVVDKYNLYNVINQCFNDVEDADFIYSGIVMEDYFDDDKNEEEEIIISKPIDQNIAEGENITAPAADKEWLKGIGINE